jgi:DNA-binding NarL/FixJ family response regulator
MRIVLADTRSNVRFALRALLRHRVRSEVVGEAANAEDLLREVERLQPDLVLLDWDLPGLGTDLLPTLRRLCPQLYVIALGVRAETRALALMAGADVYVSKTDPPEQLVAALWRAERAGADQNWMSALTLGIPQRSDDESPH